MSERGLEFEQGLIGWLAQKQTKESTMTEIQKRFITGLETKGRITAHAVRRGRRADRDHDGTVRAKSEPSLTPLSGCGC